MKRSTEKTGTLSQAEATVKATADKWPSTFVARTSIPDFTGGVYSVGYLANQDSEGKGPKGAFRIGKQIAYPVDSLTDWLISRLAV